MKRNDIVDYDKENDILYFHFGDETKESVEIFNGNIIVDFDKNLNIVGIEIFNFLEEVKRFAKKNKIIIKNNRKNSKNRKKNGKKAKN